MGAPDAVFSGAQFEIENARDDFGRDGRLPGTSPSYGIVAVSPNIWYRMIYNCLINRSIIIIG